MWQDDTSSDDLEAIEERAYQKAQTKLKAKQDGKAKAMRMALEATNRSTPRWVVG